MIDYLGLKNKATQNVNDLLANRPQGIEDYLAQARKRIEGARNQNLDALGGTLSSIGQGYNLGSIPTDSSQIRRNLSNSLAMDQAQQRLNLNRANMTNRLNQYGNQIQDSQNVLDLNRNYSQATANQAIQQQQEAKMNEMQREQARKMAEYQQNYANQGAFLQNQNLYPQADYQSSLMRVLTGLPVQIGTSMFLNKMYPMNSQLGDQIQKSVYNPNAYSGIGPSQNLGFYPQHPDFLY